MDFLRKPQSLRSTSPYLQVVGTIDGMFNSFFFGGGSRSPFRFLRLLLHFPNFVKLAWRLFVDERVPIYRKAILVLAELLAMIFAVAYLVNPLDFDFIPVFGRIDDLLIGAFLILVPGVWLFIRLCPEYIVREHVERISQGQ